ncbi:hypothetical protein B0H17DRAFT_639054 [Mycena rosella]|uniref:Uncharacterized protein n=1 Tax=Mycena rosella TaxID=1033263 RepID=A0AAD7DES8_MYCRO|nr:hypothetical protein B0H17DRAFT_639054 [Mycena rosella]
MIDVVEACSECSPRPVEEPVAPEHDGTRARVTRPSASRRSPRLSSPRVHSSPLPRQARWHPSPILSPATEYDFVTEQQTRTRAPPVRSGSYRRLTLPLSCLTADHYVPITSDGRPPQMCEVFVSTLDLAVHHGPPQDLPPLPLLGSPQRDALPRTTSPEDFRSPSPRDFRSPSPKAFDSSLVQGYLNMLAQKPQEAGTSSTASSSRATYDSLATHDFDLGSDFGSPPLFGASAYDLDAYLTSPVDPSYDDDFGTPPDDTPFSTFLATPPLPSGDLDVGEYEYGGMSLFGGISGTAAPPYETPRSAHRYATSPEPPVSDKSMAADLFWTPRDGKFGAFPVEHPAAQAEGWTVARGKEEAVKRPLEDTAGPLNAKRKRLSI